MKDIRVMDNGNWIDLSDLPRWESGSYKGKINWKESVGYKCKFKYDDIEGEIEIVGYDKEARMLMIKYLNYDLFEINYSSFLMCSLGDLLKKKTSEFKIEVGQILKDNKRDLIIIDREYRPRYTKDGKFKCKDKYYKYHCNKCSNEDWIVESALLNLKVNCNICTNEKAKLGFNTIWDKARWMVDLGVSEEDSKKYTPQSGKKITVKCPDCGKEKRVIISSIFKCKSIGCNSCSDGISFSEKFIINLLNQLGIKYKREYSPEWIKPKRYDFYFELDNKKYIIEAHGEQHYINGFTSCGGNSLEEEKQNDKFKKELALSNGINDYIILDCRESSLDWIKSSIINSKLNKIFDLSNVDWFKCEKFALKSLYREICDYWKEHNDINNENLSTKDLAEIFSISHGSINRSLLLGYKHGWCNADPEERKKSKQIEVFDTKGKSLGVFISGTELSRQSEKLFGQKLPRTSISYAAKNNKEYKGYIFKYISLEEYKNKL